VDKHVGAQVKGEVEGIVDAKMDLEGPVQDVLGLSVFFTIFKGAVEALKLTFSFDSPGHDNLSSELSGHHLSQVGEWQEAHSNTDGLWWVIERILSFVSDVKFAIFSKVFKSISHHFKTIIELLNGPKLEVVFFVVVDLNDNLVSESSLLAVVSGRLSHF
jgi:hypothetical protein